MLKLVADGERGRLVGLGLSYDNLELLAAGNPIAFPREQVGLGSGTMFLSAGEHQLTEDLEAMQSTEDRMVRLSPRQRRSLRDGDLIELPLSDLELDEDGTLLLFAGPDESTLLSAMRQAGLVTAQTEITDTTIGEIVSTHRMGMSHAGGQWLGAALCLVLGIGFFVLAVLGELEFLAAPFGLLLAGGGVWLTVLARRALSTRLELGTGGLRLRHEGRDLSLQWSAVVEVESVPLRTGLLGEQTSTAAVKLYGSRGEVIALTRDLSDWRSVLRTLRRELRVGLHGA